MLKSLGFVGLWLVASCAAIAVAWAGVATVGNEIVAPAPAPTSTQTPVGSGDGLETPGADSPDTSDDVDSTETVVATVSPIGSDSEGDPGTDDVTPPTASLAVPVTSSPTTSTAPPPASPSPEQTTTTTAAPTPTATAPPVTTPLPTTTTQPAGTTETFVLIGGTTTVRYEPTGATVLWANANPDFDVSIEPESPGWKVEFRSDNHRSRVDVWWSNGPQSEIREEADG